VITDPVHIIYFQATFRVVFVAFNHNNNNKMASFEIIPIEQGDNDPLTRIGYRAFADDLLNKRLYNLVDATPSEVEEDLQWRIDRNGRRMHSAGNHWFKAVATATGKPVGYSGILAPEKGKPKGFDTDDSVMPVTMNKELHALMGEKGKALRRQHLGERDDYWCEFKPLCHIPWDKQIVQQLTGAEDVLSMAVDPEYQGHGIARRMMQKLCELADEAGQDIYLESTTAGLPLYKRAGFEVLGELSMLDGEYLMSSMLRKPKTSA
jgi:ribosomal protein S18 acetylase RimI-like enzyme